MLPSLEDTDSPGVAEAVSLRSLPDRQVDCDGGAHAEFALYGDFTIVFLNYAV